MLRLPRVLKGRRWVQLRRRLSKLGRLRSQIDLAVGTFNEYLTPHGTYTKGLIHSSNLRVQSPGASAGSAGELGRMGVFAPPDYPAPAAHSGTRSCKQQH